jgi:lysine/ornithine N-monooxygenase
MFNSPYNSIDFVILVTPNITLTFKNYFKNKNRIFGILYFGEMTRLRSRHLILWSSETLIGQQRFYGTRLVMQKERYYHLLSILSEVGCIVDFVLNC